MNGRGLVVVAVLSALGGLIVGAHWGASTSQELAGAADAEIRAVLLAQDEAWNAGDLDRFLETYWRDDELTFSSGGKVKKGFNAVRERYRQRYQAEGKEMGKLTFSGLKIDQISDDLATARAQWKLELTNETVGGLFILILRRFPDGWKIVHDHTSQTEPPKKE